jgi:hypothetical protein
MPYKSLENRSAYMNWYRNNKKINLARDAPEKPYEYMPYVPPIGFYITIADGSRKWIPRRELMAR